MNPVQQNPTVAAHQDLKNVLLNGRILINGMPLTGNELGTIVRGEQILFEKASQLDKASQFATDKKKPTPPQGKIIPIETGKKKKE